MGQRDLRAARRQSRCDVPADRVVEEEHARANGPGVFHLVGCGGVSQGGVEAVRQFRASAEQRPALGQDRDSMHATGRRVVQDDAKAVRCYHRSTEKPHARAPASIRWMYENGSGVRQARVAAFMSIAGHRTTAISGRGSNSLDFGELCDGPQRHAARREPYRRWERFGGFARPLDRVG